jgi:hypothetical protein
MPVDMVLAISHNRMTRDRQRVVLESKNNSETIKNIAGSIADNITGNILYDKRVSKDLVIEKNKQQSCLEMFRVW